MKISLLLLLFLLRVLVCDGNDHDPTFAVAMTTIPPRFSSIHHTLDSWLSQEGYKPLCVVVFVPKSYKRFKRKSNNDTATTVLTTADFLDHSIRKHAPPHISSHLDSGIIRLVQVKHDLGPATKLAGILQHRSKLARESPTPCAPAFWVFGDDDVAYTPKTLFLYTLKMAMPPPGISDTELRSMVLTHFSEDVRLSVKLVGEGGAVRRVTHIQGVDTVLLPATMLQSQYDRCQILHPAVFTRILETAFKVCPDSFYQDDYVIALLFNLAGVRVVSAWNNDHVAKHVEGVSKSNSQLHTKKDVFKKEDNTKACLALKVDKLVEVADRVGHQLLERTNRERKMEKGELR